MEDNDDQSTINSADGVGSLQTNPKKHVGVDLAEASFKDQHGIPN